jgi:hypothetical protein
VAFFPLLRDQLRFRWYAFAPFALLIVAWLSIGYPLMTDYSSPSLVPAAVFGFEVLWMAFYLFGWGFSFMWRPKS